LRPGDPIVTTRRRTYWTLGGSWLLGVALALGARNVAMVWVLTADLLLWPYLLLRRFRRRGRIGAWIGQGFIKTRYPDDRDAQLRAWFGPMLPSVRLRIAVFLASILAAQVIWPLLWVPSLVLAALVWCLALADLEGLDDRPKQDARGTDDSET